MGKQQSNSPKSVREQIEDSAKDLWSTVMTLDKRPAIPRDTSTNDQKEPQQMSLENVIRIMFGSCTNGIDPSNDEPPTVCASSKNEKSMSKESFRGPVASPPSPKKDPDAVYRNIFADNRARAEVAVSHVREHMEHQKPAKTPARQNNVPGMFPASSPQRHIAVPALPKDPPATIQKSQSESGNLSRDFSFDDGISIITQLTLEDLAKMYEGTALSRVYSDITQDPVDQVEESWKQTVTPRSEISRSPPSTRTSPVRLARSNRSQCTTHTRRSYGAKSMGTKSSMSTQTNEFANVWQREEQRYWEDVVREQEWEGFAPTEQMSISNRHKKLSRAREIARKGRLLSSDRSRDEQNSKRDGTTTTAHSTVFSGLSSYPERSLTATQRDPDRFLEVLIMPPGTEMGEI